MGGTVIGHIDYDGYPRQPMECSADSSCPAGLRCFHLTAEVGICDAPSPPSVDQCTPADRLDTPPFEQKSSDACGCNGLSCTTGLRCRYVEATCSCGSSGHNVCVDTPCASPSDCTDGTVCRPSSYILGPGERCVVRSCASDADCSDCIAHGRCVVVLRIPSQAGEVRIAGIRCEY